MSAPGAGRRTRSSRVLTVATAEMVLLVAVVLRPPAVTSSIRQDNVAREYFLDAERACEEDRARLWGLSLCGPALLVDSDNHRVVANMPDAKGTLKPLGAVFVGSLPKDMPVANSEVEWLGMRWSEIDWPPPGTVQARRRLSMHEAFHRIEPRLGLSANNSAAPAQYLDSYEGRVLIRLEWRALGEALRGANHGGHQEIRDALLFRRRRQAMDTSGTKQENALEVHEGLAEYTGIRLMGASHVEQVNYVIRKLQTSERLKSFARSSAYISGPAYAFLLDDAAPGWRLRVTPESDLSELLQKALQIELSTKAEQSEVNERSTLYAVQAIRHDEEARQQRRLVRTERLKQRFVIAPLLVLPLDHMSVEFSNDMISLGGFGNVYPSLKIRDDWGALNAEGGALLSSDWRQATVPAPATTTVKGDLKGPGWTLSLNPGWILCRGRRLGDFTVRSVP
jgi:hypothetical protein